MSVNAYSAHVTMTEAKWTDKEGSTVTFKLPMKGMEGQRNPFEKWTKRRKGLAGTRFAAGIVTVVNGQVGQVVYDNDVMLAGWNDSQTNGHTVKFWLAMDAMGHPFEGFERNKDKFYLSLAELDDDDSFIDQKQRDKVEASSKRPSERVSYVAAMLCKNEGFWTYIKEEDESGWEQMGGDDDPEESARQFILWRLQIKSRSELDKSIVMAERFHEEVRRPFLMWQGEY